MNRKLFLLGFMITIAWVSMAFSCSRLRKTTADADRIQMDTAAVVVETPAEISKELATYERTACFGMCPIFKMIVYTDGKVLYSGKNNVNLIGQYQTHVDKATLQKIEDTANSIGYFSMQHEYDNANVQDLPSIYCAVKNGTGELYSVKNRWHGPNDLKTLYAVFDNIIESAKWELQK
jgi:hypothetical protein